MQTSLGRLALLLAALIGTAVLVWIVADQRRKPIPGGVRVDTSVRFQTMRGWEATAYAGQESPGFDAIKDTLFDQAVNDLGINRIRLEVRSGAEHTRDAWSESQAGAISADEWSARRYVTVNDNDDPHTIDPSGFQWSELDDIVDRIVAPLRARVEANGERLWINLCYVAFLEGGGAAGPYVHADPQEYAEFVEAVYLHLDAKYGWVPDSWEVILEPDNVPEWTGTKIGQALVAAAARLKARGWTPRFVAPSTTDTGRAVAYFDELARVPGALEHLIEISYHRYTGVSEAHLRSLRSRAEAHGIDTAHLEWIGATHRELHEDLLLSRASSWSQFVLATLGPDDGGGYYVVDESGGAAPSLRLGRRARLLRQYFKYVRFGAQRVGAYSDGANLSPMAFLNRDGGLVVVIAAARPTRITLEGLPPGTYAITYNAGEPEEMALPDAEASDEGALRVVVPVAGVVTVRGRRR